MKVGDYVAKITNDWQKHNGWMEFPDEKPEPLGMIVARSYQLKTGYFLDVLMSCGGIERFSERFLVVINDNN